MKRRRTSLYGGLNDADGEPPTEIQLPPNTSTVLVDTKLNSVIPTNVFVNANNTLVKANATKEGTRNIANTRAGENVANTINRINPIYGCDRFQYFGDFGSDSDYGFHTGNSLVLVRFLVSNAILEDYRVIDMFVKLPEGLSFPTGLTAAELARLSQYFNVLFAGEYWFSCKDVYHSPTEGVALPGIGAWYNGQIFSCLQIAGGRLAFVLQTAALVEGYTATFRLLDHPNSVYSRGSNISGFGYLSSKNRNGNAQSFAYQDSSMDPKSATDLKIDPQTFLDFDEGIVSLETFLEATDSSKNVAGVVYIAPRPPTFLDARYYLINMPEMTFDSKAGIISNQHVITFETVGIQLMDYEEQRKREYQEDPAEDFVLTNPKTNLAFGSSHMSIQLSRLNDFGEPTSSGLVAYGIPAVNVTDVFAFQPGAIFDSQNLCSLFSKSILMNLTKNINNDTPAQELEGLFVDSEYFDNGVRLNPASTFVHFGLNFMT